MYENAVSYFQKFVDANRANPGKATAYGSKKSRLMRYWATNRLPYLVGDSWQGATVLDVGCGPGHFYEWMRANNAETFHYEGVDITPGMVELAAQKGLDAYIHQGTVFDSHNDKYDWVVANGIFGIAYDEDWATSVERAKDIIEAMMGRARKGVAFDFIAGPNRIESSKNQAHGTTEGELQVSPQVMADWLCNFRNGEPLRFVIDTSVSHRFFTCYVYFGENLFETQDDEFFNRNVFR